MIPVLGIDPGKVEGGAVLLAADGKTALAAWHWIERRRKAGNVYVVREQWGDDLDSCDVSTLHHIGEGLRRITTSESGAFDLVVEALFVPRLPKSALAGRMSRQEVQTFMGKARSVHALAEAAALVYGPLTPYGAHLVRPLASAWRPLILGLPASVSSDVAEQTAIRVLSGRRPLISGLGELAKNPHVAEAAMIARFGWVKQRERLKVR